jgi:hypothetical protein
VASVAALSITSSIGSGPAQPFHAHHAVEAHASQLARLQACSAEVGAAEVAVHEAHLAQIRVEEAAGRVREAAAAHAHVDHRHPQQARRRQVGGIQDDGLEALVVGDRHLGEMQRVGGQVRRVR